MLKFNKVDIENKNNQKRNRRRRKNMIGYYILAAFLAAGIAGVLSVTLLFNVNGVVITGMKDSSYTEDDIIDSSGIVRGDNLIRMKTARIRERMLDKLIYIDDVEIKKNLPDKVEINIVPSKGTAYVECRGGYMLVSESWRIIGHAEQPEDRNLIVVKGFDPKTNEEKTTMMSNDSDKDEALRSILGEIKEQNIENIVSVDISDKFDIVLNYQNRIKIKIEKPDDIEYKLRYAYRIITDELRDNKSGYLIYRNSLGYSYISDEEYNRINGSVSAYPPVMTGIPETSVTDITAVSGQAPVSLTDADTAESVTEPPAPVPPAGW
ncbi:MAG: FtsQ-type POTRA domain-containing protein [Oscillospiraceae bacterium]|nr:FtsQ-type POTRA domain-containing protein [Oscillospiraceae bacterium]